jgi:hypothetical protein
LFLAQRRVTASIISDSSHKEIKAWKTAYKKGANTVSNPTDEFDRDIFTVPAGELSPEIDPFLFSLF